MVASIALVPTAANAAVTQTGAVDCAVESDHSVLVLPSDSVEITQTNCVGIEVYDGSVTPAPVEGVPAATFEIAAGSSIALFGESDESPDVYIEVGSADPLDDPSGALLATSDIEIAADPEEFTAAGAPGESHYLGGREECVVQSGDHVYETLPIEITEAGDFTFRAISTDPVSDYLDTFSLPYFPIDDPALAVYTDFDPANPDAGVVSCNDDRDDDPLVAGDGILDDDTLIDDHYPQFGATLAPGSYTLVLTTWEAIGADAWTAGQSEFGGEFEPQAQSARFQLWGPDGALVVIEAPEITSPAPSSTVTLGQPFSYSVTTTGTAPVAYAISAGVLPAGLTLNAATGVISGTPTTAGASTFTVTATNAVGTDSAEYTITAAVPVPTITVDRTEVSVDGTSLVGVSGAGFDRSTVIAIDGVVVPASNVSIVSPTRLGFIAPVRAAGPAQLTVTTAAGTSAPVTLTYVAAPVPTITAVDPGQVFVDGTSLVGVSGTAFDESTTVAIDGVTVPSLTVISDTELGFIAPAHAAGEAQLTVTTAAGTSAPFTLTYVAAPVVIPEPTPSTPVVLVPVAVTDDLVPAAVVPPATTSPRTGTLAYTGAEVAGLGLLGGLTLLGGVVLAAAARRRRAQAE